MTWRRRAAARVSRLGKRSRPIAPWRLASWRPPGAGIGTGSEESRPPRSRFLISRRLPPAPCADTGSDLFGFTPRGVTQIAPPPHEAALLEFRAATQLEPTFALAHAMAARTILELHQSGVLDPVDDPGAMARQYIARALEQDESCADVYALEQAANSLDAILPKHRNAFHRLKIQTTRAELRGFAKILRSPSYRFP
jgi:hypothetical protein